MFPSILQGDSSGVYPFDEISAAEIGFEKFSISSEILFEYSQVFGSFFLSKHSDAIIIFTH